jgi:hypothetical protein
MISAATASKLKVMGSNRAMVAVGPMPGRTPTAVPIATPIRHTMTLVGVSAASTPSCRLVQSTRGLSREQGAEQRQSQLQGDDEDQHAEYGEADRDPGGPDRTAASGQGG